MRLVHALKGYKNKNWPIKSSFFYVKDGSRAKRVGSHEPVYGKDELQPSAEDKAKYVILELFLMDFWLTILGLSKLRERQSRRN